MKKKHQSMLILGTVLLLNVLPCLQQKALAQSATDCHHIATDYANRNSRGEVLKRGAIGAGAGALTGAIFGGAGTGAAIGGGVGAVSGGSRQLQDRDNLYQAAFDDCMRGIRRP
ncbi:YMGG-like glycine zipper-containing protein [Gloeocapsa sp. PCC 73106]|uniref:YMGG-like glycine zipper-containing protein n=1 Tax=Gloeocapsa sp. PCC 73106 TaxID=102232 RepID=UPI0002ABD46C|nr:YMGG-like glycine zipper-containing protein [Gloeocapsa sp. PCC 73106]ELR97414.1 hypothetical protein GLO73106DRAFT_00012240 [Gloeocapsa sp. PCC 73106]